MDAFLSRTELETWSWIPGLELELELVPDIEQSSRMLLTRLSLVKTSSSPFPSATLSPWICLWSPREQSSSNAHDQVINGQHIVVAVSTCNDITMHMVVCNREDGE